MYLTPDLCLGLIGKVLSQLSIDNATKITHNPDNINPSAKKSIGVDAGFGSSKFVIVVTQFVDGKIQVIFAEEYDRSNFDKSNMGNQTAVRFNIQPLHECS
jgi:hypothetical protein